MKSSFPSWAPRNRTSGGQPTPTTLVPLDVSKNEGILIGGNAVNRVRGPISPSEGYGKLAVRTSLSDAVGRGPRMSDLVVENQADGSLATLSDLERLQDQVLAELDALALRIEQVLKEFGRGSPIVGWEVEQDSSAQS